MFRFSLLGVAAAFSDETSLMQGLKPVQDVKKTHDKHAVANLLESAKSMLKNGETADVVTFAEATLAEITSTVIPAIQDAHRVEQALLREHFAAFETATAALAQGVSEIHELHEDRFERTGSHLTCRETEEQKCSHKQYCDYNLYFLWKSFIIEESGLRHIENQIYHQNTGHFCAEDAHGNFIMNGTTHEFRETSVPIMNDFTRQWPEVVAAVGAYGDLRPQCETKFTALDEQTAQCDAQQATLENVACQHRVRAKVVKDTFDCAWQNAYYTYDLTEKESRLMQIDRIREFQALSTVECLLQRTTERNGRPCDEHTNEIDAELTTCEEHRRGVDISGLELDFPCEVRECGSLPAGIGPRLNPDGSHNPGCEGDLVCPELPPFCVYDDNDVLTLDHLSYAPLTKYTPWADQAIATGPGRCYPLTPAEACTTGQVFPGLPAVPQPDFHAWTVDADWVGTGNSHCNQRPVCELCQLPEDLVCPVPQWVWAQYTTQSRRLAWTVDGCVGSDAVAGEHPLSVNEDAGHTADVRCCSMDGSTCESQNLAGGEDFYLEGDLHSTNCVSGVSHAQAVAVCAAGGMRLCDSTEVQQCCGTGCWHNHHSIWVSHVVGVNAASGNAD